MLIFDPPWLDNKKLSRGTDAFYLLKPASHRAHTGLSGPNCDPCQFALYA